MRAPVIPRKEKPRGWDKEADQPFWRAVTHLLDEKLHVRRGISAEEYIALCRQAWDECEASPSFPFKILSDPFSAPDLLLANSRYDYLHWRAADVLESTREPSTEIRCVAVGPVKPDLSTGPDEGERAPAEEPETPETRRYILAVFDVLGFSALFETKGLGEMTSLYAKLITETVTKESMDSFNLVRINDTEQVSAWGPTPIRHAHFSDTIFLWAPLVQHFIAPFMARCADLVCEALRMGLPLRGALAVGPAVMHSRTGTFVGLPVIEAAKLEQAQNWVGVTLGLSMLASDVSREFDPNLVIPYTVPFKKGKIQVPTNLALDWPRRFKTRFGTSPAVDLRALDQSPKHHIYYANADKFAEFSSGPLYRSEGLAPLNLGELVQAAANAYSGSAPLSSHHLLVLKDLRRSGAVGAAVADFIHSIASGEAPPEMPKNLPQQLQRYLRDLELLTGGGGKYFQLTDCAVGALAARLTGKPIGKEDAETLRELDLHGKAGERASQFFRELAAGSHPKVPRGLPRGMAGFLRETLAWAENGDVPSGLLRRLAEGCLKARLRDGELDEFTAKALAAVSATEGEWNQIAEFLRGIASGEDPPIPPGASRSSTNDLMRISCTAQMAGVQQPRILEIVSVGFGDPATGIDLFSLTKSLAAFRDYGNALPEEAESAIAKFEEGAPERAVVADCLRSTVTRHPRMEQPRDLPVAVRLVLLQIEAVVEGKPIPLDPSLVGFAALRSRHGGGPMGDCILFSLRALAAAGKEERRLAEYLWTVANRGPAAPAPNLSDRELAATAEEVRCLADPEVGGFRLMMSPAEKSIRHADPDSLESTV